jgi:hypothetical protein
MRFASVIGVIVYYGYEQGFRSGQADRQDRWQSGYQDSYAYQDANYGYGRYYVDQSDYNYYFREGFRRGYEDGYDSRHQYGRYSNGKYAKSWVPFRRGFLTFSRLAKKLRE